MTALKRRYLRKAGVSRLHISLMRRVEKGTKLESTTRSALSTTIYLHTVRDACKVSRHILDISMTIIENPKSTKESNNKYAFKSPNEWQ